MTDMTHMALIERVAKAIYMCRNGLGCRPWINIEASHRTPYRDDARAAIATIAEALREPTPSMNIAGAIAWCDRETELSAEDDKTAVDPACACIKAAIAASPLNGEHQ